MNLLPNTAPKMAIFFGLLVGIDTIKHGTADPWPYLVAQAPRYVVLFLLFLLFAAFAPELAGTILGGIVLLSALGAAGPIADWIRARTVGSLPNPATRGK